MRSIPIQEKPQTRTCYYDIPVIRAGAPAYEIPNAVSHDIAKEINDYALGGTSGLHRRGSKSEWVTASFSTCQIHPFSHCIYNIIDPLWVQYINDIKHQINFIEPYEIKLYYPGDGFSYHYDHYADPNLTIDRKINLIIQLSDPESYEGGNLVVGDYVYPRTFGSALFFSADLIHKVTPITKGTRVVLIGHAWGPS